MTEDEIRLMLKIGDRFNRYGGEEVDFEDFMYIMLQAKLYTEDSDRLAASQQFAIPMQNSGGFSAAVANSDQKFGEMGLV